MFIRFANFYLSFLQGFSKIAVLLTSILKINPQSASILLAISVDNSEVVGSSSENNRKLAKSDFTKLVHRAKESSFLILNAK